MVGRKKDLKTWLFPKKAYSFTTISNDIDSIFEMSTSELPELEMEMDSENVLIMYGFQCLRYDTPKTAVVFMGLARVM